MFNITKEVTRSLFVNNSFGTILSRYLSKVKKSIAYCGIRKLEVNQEIYESNLGSKSCHPIDKFAGFILEKNISVPELALTLPFMKKKQHFKSNPFKNIALKPFHASRYSHLPDIFKVSSYSCLDDQIILDNLEDLIIKLDLNSQREEVKQKMFEFEDLPQEHLVAKCNILGHYLSQGLDDLRLPMDVFNRSKLLLRAPMKKKRFTSDEDQRIIKAFEEPISDKERQEAVGNLARTFGRQLASIYHRYDKVLKHKDKAKSGTFSLEEDQQILDTVFNKYKVPLKELESCEIEFDLWEKLGCELNRRPVTVYHHWTILLLPLLIRFDAGVHHVDHRQLLIEHFVKNNIEYSQEANWSEIVKRPEFKGTNSQYLQKIYNTTRVCTKRRFPKLENADITSSKMLEYLHSRYKQVPYDGRRGLKQREELLEYYVENYK